MEATVVVVEWQAVHVNPLPSLRRKWHIPTIALVETRLLLRATMPEPLCEAIDPSRRIPIRLVSIKPQRRQHQQQEEQGPPRIANLRFARDPSPGLPFQSITTTTSSTTAAASTRRLLLAMDR